MYLAALAACDREPAVWPLESPERVDECVHPGRVHERDFGQIHDDRTGLVLENRQQGLPQDGSGAEVDLPVDAEHGYVLMLPVCHQEDPRHRFRPLGDVGLLGS